MDSNYKWADMSIDTGLWTNDSKPIHTLSNHKQVNNLQTSFELEDFFSSKMNTQPTRNSKSALGAHQISLQQTATIAAQCSAYTVFEKVNSDRISHME